MTRGAAPVRVGLAPRWAGTAASDWYPWLDTARRGVPARRRWGVLDVIASGNPPVVEKWVPRLVRWLGDDPDTLARTVLVGHSTGCQAWLRALATLPPGCAVAGLVCVAGWWAIDEPWDTIQPWMTLDFDVRRARAAARSVEVLLSDDDPYTADQVTNAGLWASRLGARVKTLAGARHFNEAPRPDVLAALDRVWPAAS